MDTTHVKVAFIAFLVKLPSSGRFEGFCLAMVHYTSWENTLHKKTLSIVRTSKSIHYCHLLHTRFVSNTHNDVILYVLLKEQLTAIISTIEQ